MKGLMILMAAILLLGTWGCDTSSGPKLSANVVMLGELMQSISYDWQAEDIIYSARLKNEGDLAATHILFWVTCYDSLGQFVITANASSPDSLFPGNSRMIYLDLGWSSEGGPGSHGWGIDSVATDIEWRD